MENVYMQAERDGLRPSGSDVHLVDQHATSATRRASAMGLSLFHSAMSLVVEFVHPALPSHASCLCDSSVSTTWRRWKRSYSEVYCRNSNLSSMRMGSTAHSQ